jgi:putative transcriptional regulator
MPIVVTLDVMLAKRKMSLMGLSERIGITTANVSLLKTSKVRAIRFSTLDHICRVLECKPGDILDYVDDETYKKLFGHSYEPPE